MPKTVRDCRTVESGPDHVGGGFSTLSTRPNWQDDAVKAYLALNRGLPPEKAFNSSNRGYPDVLNWAQPSFVSEGYEDKRLGPFDGTSASAPIWTAIVTRLNNARVAEGKRPDSFCLSFISFNKVPEGFHDIAKGDNKCTVASEAGNEDQCCRYGFEATGGTVTGEFLESILLFLLVASPSNATLVLIL